jgi:hypothetical protein
MGPLIALLTLALAIVTVHTPAAASSHMDLTGEYRGFTQSSRNPDLRMFMELLVEQDDGVEFAGRLTLGPLPFTFKGERLDALGNRFDGRGRGPAGEVRFIGTIQGLGDEGGVLALATYIFFPATGGRADADEGTADFIRAPFTPPDPCIVLVGGAYRGTYGCSWAASSALRLTTTCPPR